MLRFALHLHNLTFLFNQPVVKHLEFFLNIQEVEPWRISCTIYKNTVALNTQKRHFQHFQTLSYTPKYGDNNNVLSHFLAVFALHPGSLKLLQL